MEKLERGVIVASENYWVSPHTLCSGSHDWLRELEGPEKVPKIEKPQQRKYSWKLKIYTK